MNSDIRQLLEAVKSGETSVDDALLEIKKAPFEDIGYAKVDLHRKIRQGAAEVIYGAGKTPEQIAGIVDAMQKNGTIRCEKSPSHATVACENNSLSARSICVDEIRFTGAWKWVVRSVFTTPSPFERRVLNRNDINGGGESISR